MGSGCYPQGSLDNVLNIMNGTIGGILLLDEQSQTLTYCVHQGLSAKYVDEVRVRSGEGIAGRVISPASNPLWNDP